MTYTHVNCFAVVIIALYIPHKTKRRKRRISTATTSIQRYNINVRDPSRCTIRGKVPHLDTVLLQIVGHFCQRGGFPHAVDADENHRVYLASRSRRLHLLSHPPTRAFLLIVHRSNQSTRVRFNYSTASPAKTPINGLQTKRSNIKPWVIPAIVLYQLLYCTVHLILRSYQ